MNYIYDKLSTYTKNTFKYYGGIGKKVLKDYEENINKINENNENKIIVATCSYIGEGFDNSKLDTLFLTMPISGQTRVTQYVGEHLITIDILRESELIRTRWKIYQRKYEYAKDIDFDDILDCILKMMEQRDPVVV